MYPGLDLYYTDPARHLITADQDTDDLDDIDDLDRDVSVRRVNGYEFLIYDSVKKIGAPFQPGMPEPPCPVPPPDSPKRGKKTKSCATICKIQETLGNYILLASCSAFLLPTNAHS